ncbi:uncharacterized protein N7459_007144 [Penicillium hispanicum]|uniref:uncharacterized protein n=1 Tax=Penicillium hispanicum TaxID=1080232 RepID=UPI002540A581|nr:uncharacterized protein N7459_007144 [Penicillium hispanicum]KAJ5578180.1 hypothetical protein N7459_007144 [Penicillium hispanicum]
MDDGESSAEFAAVDGLSNRTRSNSASSGHRRSLPSSLLSRLSFLRMNQAAQSESSPHGMEQDGDSEDIAPNMAPIHRDTLAGGKAMAAVIQQQQRRTRRRRGSLRKTALLGTRLESRDKRAASKSADAVRVDSSRRQDDVPVSPRDTTSPSNHEFPPSGSFDADAEDAQPIWIRASAAQKIPRPSFTRRHQGLAPHNLLGEETATDDEDLVSFPRIGTANTSARPGANNISSAENATTGLHITTTSSGSDAYYPLPADAAYRSVYRNKSSPLATHPVEMKSSGDISWDYSETESWGWIILIVTWLVFVVGMGSCFEVWSWAWDVGETPYAPPELEDDPTLPIVGYYPALIVLTAVMSWVWVVVAWVGMKYFKHANISGDDI